MRDIILNVVSVADVDFEVDCNVVDVVGIWGSDNCYSNSEQTIVHIGQVVSTPN